MPFKLHWSCQSHCPFYAIGNFQACDGTFVDFDSLFKVFSPASFDGENFMKYRVFRKEPDQETGKPTSTYKGRAAVVVSKNTPLIFRYSLKDSKVQVSFCVQQYTENDFAVDASLQTLVNMD